MKLITNHISTGKSKSFSDYVQGVVGKKASADADSVVKTASVKKEAEGKDEAEGSGQLEVEPLHQVGESTPSPHKGEEKASSDVVDHDNENNDVAEDSGQPKAEEKLNNDPEAEKHHEASKEVEVKEASVEKEACDDSCGCKPNCECKGGVIPCEDPHNAQASASEEVEVKKATQTAKFVRVANLDDKSRNWLKDYWMTMYPEAFVDAMLQDK